MKRNWDESMSLVLTRGDVAYLRDELANLLHEDYDGTRAPAIQPILQEIARVLEPAGSSDE